VEALKIKDMEMAHMKLMDQFARHEMSGHENDGPNDKTSSEWPH